MADTLKVNFIDAASYLVSMGSPFPTVIQGTKPGWVSYQFDDPDGEVGWMLTEYEVGREDETRAQCNASRLFLSFRKLREASDAFKKEHAHARK